MIRWDQDERERLRDGLAAAGADGWLLFDFQEANPVARRVLGLTGLGSRRLFVLLPREGEPVAVAHRIELQALQEFPGRIVPYARYGELHQALRDLVQGRTLAMEISPNDDVPYLDRVPWGVVELIRGAGATVVPSAPLVTTFAARWSARELEDHLVAAEALARIARQAVGEAVREIGLSETALQARVVTAMEGEGFTMEHAPIVGFGAHAADPHYQPVAGQDAILALDQVVLLDLFGGRPGSVPADQTWMGFSGSPPAKVQRVWETVRDARDAALDAVQRAAREGTPLQGRMVDRAARDLIEAAGFGDFFVHRTGHSIDRALHGSGPHCDDYETRDDRLLLPGVGFSVEPGIYLAGEFGIRSEVNVYWGADGPIVTPGEIQRELIVPR